MFGNVLIEIGTQISLGESPRRDIQVEISKDQQGIFVRNTEVNRFFSMMGEKLYRQQSTSF